MKCCLIKSQEFVWGENQWKGKSGLQYVSWPQVLQCTIYGTIGSYILHCKGIRTEGIMQSIERERERERERELKLRAETRHKPFVVYVFWSCTILISACSCDCFCLCSTNSITTNCYGILKNYPFFSIFIHSSFYFYQAEQSFANFSSPFHYFPFSDFNSMQVCKSWSKINI